MRLFFSYTLSGWFNEEENIALHQLADSSHNLLDMIKQMSIMWCDLENRSHGVKINGVPLEYPTTYGFQWGHLKNGPYTYTISGGNGRVFENLAKHTVLKYVWIHVFFVFLKINGI